MLLNGAFCKDLDQFHGQQDVVLLQSPVVPGSEKLSLAFAKPVSPIFNSVKRMMIGERYGKQSKACDFASGDLNAIERIGSFFYQMNSAGVDRCRSRKPVMQNGVSIRRVKDRVRLIAFDQSEPFLRI